MNEKRQSAVLSLFITFVVYSSTFYLNGHFQVQS